MLERKQTKSASDKTDSPGIVAALENLDYVSPKIHQMTTFRMKITVDVVRVIEGKTTFQSVRSHLFQDAKFFFLWRCCQQPIPHRREVWSSYRNPARNNWANIRTEWVSGGFLALWVYSKNENNQL